MAFLEDVSVKILDTNKNKLNQSAFYGGETVILEGRWTSLFAPVPNTAINFVIESTKGETLLAISSRTNAGGYAYETITIPSVDASAYVYAHDKGSISNKIPISIGYASIPKPDTGGSELDKGISSIVQVAKWSAIAVLVILSIILILYLVNALHVPKIVRQTAKSIKAAA